jgi:hypothetical protein
MLGEKKVYSDDQHIKWNIPAQKSRRATFQSLRATQRFSHSLSNQTS